MRTSLFAFVTGALLTACAGGVAPDSSPAPVEGVPVQTWTVDVQNPPARDIYLRNDDTVDHVIFDLQLFACENLKQVCGAYTPNVVIPAGKTVKAMRIEPDRTTLPWKYQYRFHTRAVRPPEPVATITPSPMRMTTFSRTGPMPFVGLANVEEFKPRVPAPSGEGACSRNGQQQGPAGGKTVVMFFNGDRPDAPTMAFVDLDVAGRPVLYTETRGANRVPPGTPGADTSSPRTIISIRVAQNIAELVNEGGNKPPEYFTVTGPAIMNAVSLGRPAEGLARVLRECGGN